MRNKLTFTLSGRKYSSVVLVKVESGLGGAGFDLCLPQLSFVLGIVGIGYVCPEVSEPVRMVTSLSCFIYTCVPTKRARITEVVGHMTKAVQYIKFRFQFRLQAITKTVILTTKNP